MKRLLKMTISPEQQVDNNGLRSAVLDLANAMKDVTSLASSDESLRGDDYRDFSSRQL